MYNKNDAKKVIQILKDYYPDAKCSLDFTTPFEMVIATILSAQCTDERVNKTTPYIFSKYSTPEDFANMDIKELEALIHPCGFYKNKAKNIKACSHKLINEFNGVVPQTAEELMSLPGVGRKTANCVMVFAFELPAIPVDTHVHRISNRLGLVDTKDPEDTEVELCKIAPEELWIKLNDLMVQFGQNICKPISPQCEICPCTDICDYFAENI